MGEQTKLTMIGAFVLGAVVLFVVSILVFGTGKIFSEKEKFVLYFDAPVSGLTQGAPVNFRGVQIGRVINVFVRVDYQDTTVSTPVYIEIEPGRIDSAHKPEHLVEKDFIDVLVGLGLRANLKMESIITGQLAVEFDFHPDTPVVLHGEGQDKYPEIPTIASGFEKLTQSLETLPIEEMIQTAIDMMGSIERLTSSAELQESVVAFRNTMQRMEVFLVKMDGIVDENSEFRYQVEEMLLQLAEAARSVGLLADYLQQHPEAIVHGKR